MHARRQVETLTGQNNIPQFPGALKNLSDLLRRPVREVDNDPMGKSRMALLAVCLLTPNASSGQSLAEVAKKERERRAQAGKAGNPSAVISEKELEEARGDSLSVSGTESGEPAAGPSEEEAAAAAEAGAGSKLTAKEIRDLRAEWARIWQEQMSQAEQELEQAEDDAYQCRSAERYFFVPVAVDCEGVDLRLAGAKARLKKVKLTRYNWELLLPTKNPSP